MFERRAGEIANAQRGTQARRWGTARPRTAARDDLHKGAGAGRAFAVVFAALCFAITLAAPDSLFEVPALQLLPPSEWPGWFMQLHWVLGFLVAAPFAVVAVVGRDLRVTRERGQQLQLIAHTPSLAAVPAAHLEEDSALWNKRLAAAQTLWKYEKERIAWLQGRLVMQALILGDVTTFALMCSALLAASGPRGDMTVPKLACSIAAAAGTAFLINLARIMLRVSGGDVTSRTFSWAIQSVVMVTIADIGLYVLLDSDTSKVVSGVPHALLLGIFVGATGDHAIEFLLEKASRAFSAGTAAEHKASPLLEIEGITDAHVDRLEEEGVVSIHDLAFVPTARLFFSTAFSLQQICNWQDRALLHVYVGKDAARTLAEKMHVRGAIDLRALAHDVVFGSGKSDPKDVKDALSEALSLGPGGLAALLESMAHDEAAMRIRCYWGAAIAPSQPEDDEPRPAIEVGAPPPPPDASSGPSLPRSRAANGSTPPSSPDASPDPGAPGH